MEPILLHAAAEALSSVAAEGSACSRPWGRVSARYSQHSVLEMLRFEPFAGGGGSLD